MKSAMAACATAVLLLLSGCAGDDSSVEDEATRFDATATVNISRAHTATAEARAATSPTAPPTSTPAVATATADQANVAATPEAADPAASPETSEEQIAETIAGIEQAVTDLRGLEPLQDVPSAIIGREQLRRNLIAMLEEEYSQEEADQDTLAMWLLRLIDDPSLDFYQFQLDLLTERVLGYYDPEKDELFVISDEDGLSPLAEMTMAHEFIHALQDQHYDFERLIPEDSYNADRDTAVSALTEGDAEVASTLYLLEHMEPGELAEVVAESQAFPTDVIDQAPPYIRESLYFPYQAGAEFVMGLYQSGGFDAVDAALADPPTSTEQILHPEKYTGERDDPQQVELPDVSGALGPDWSRQDTDTLGELDFRIMLRENGATNFTEAAAGWDGARFDLYRNGEDAVVALKTIWDSEGDATEFADAMRATLGGQLAEGVWDAGQGRVLSLRQAGDAVWVITSTNRQAVEQATAAVDG